MQKSQSNQDVEQPLSYKASLISGVVGGLLSGIIGGGLFGILVLIAEEFDGKYDDPSLWTMIMGAPFFAFIGLIFGSPFGLIGGLLYGAVAPKFIPVYKATMFGTIGGALVGLAIGGSLQGVPLRGDWEDFFWGALLLMMGGICGAIGGRVGGLVYQRMAKRWSSTNS